VANLSDYIEEYLKKLIALSSSRTINIQRNELAEKFDCVPSQINYVLATRFTLDKGYLVESRRGGRGYVRITRVHFPKSASLFPLLEEAINERMGIKESRDLLQRLYEERILSLREARMAEAAIEAIDEREGAIRAKLLKKMLIAILKK
jgi:transcriptional regulator CtsR